MSSGAQLRVGAGAGRPRPCSQPGSSTLRGSIVVGGVGLVVLHLQPALARAALVAARANSTSMTGSRRPWAIRTGSPRRGESAPSPRRRDEAGEREDPGRRPAGRRRARARSSSPSPSRSRRARSARARPVRSHSSSWNAASAAGGVEAVRVGRTRPAGPGTSGCPASRQRQRRAWRDDVQPAARDRAHRRGAAGRARRSRARGGGRAGRAGSPAAARCAGESGGSRRCASSSAATPSIVCSP